DIARQMHAEIISGDSRQMYKLMDIGTAKPSPEDLKQVKHYFVDDRFPDQNFNAAEFGIQGRKTIDDILERGKIPLVVGGSGLYIQGLIDGFFDDAAPDDELRSSLYDRIEQEGSEKLLEELRSVDPAAASTMLPSNKKRIVRALEVFHLTGQPISTLQGKTVTTSFNPVFVGLSWNRKKLYDRINRRVDRMIEQGLVEEAQMLKSRGYDPSLNALQTVGYKEAFEFLRGAITHKRMVDLIKQQTRRYAKRQLTWFRHDDRITWFSVEDESDFPLAAKRIVEHFLQHVN
ncbi:MAG TPA: tRNA (adenosine(37)-N6)-dimethylallyltransferase MiaA, partial [Bacteroidota bacterium]|nr:tRNA (adenosine(37)-N6)-dimethylallyltransferase MiaA [Bacteroidota bacterium]